jgi:hypothetical protein
MKHIILFNLFLTFYAFSFGQHHEYSFMEEYDLKGIQYFTLSTSDGFIDVKPSETNDIRVYYRVEKGGEQIQISREELESQVELTESFTTDHLKIKIQQRGKNRWSDWKNRMNVSCEVFLPSTVSCTLKSSDGDIRIKDMEANQKMRTSDGDIQASSIKGDVEAITSDGDVKIMHIAGSLFLETSDGDIKATDVDGNTSCSTSDGDIELEGVSGLTEATTSDGDIRFEDLSGGFIGVTSDGDVRGSILQLKRKVSVSTSDGDIKLEVPSDSRMDLTMKGEDLVLPRVELNGKISDHSIEGSVNGGGVPVRLVTSDGQVVLSFR